MSKIEQIPTVNGVCPLIYRIDKPSHIMVVQELTAKELTGKLSGQWGPGFETIEPGENHRNAIDRFLKEEVLPTRGSIAIPERLEESKLCTVRVSPEGLSPEAWVHVYPVPVSPDFEGTQGSFVHEVSKPIWVDAKRVLATQGVNSRSMLFRTGTYEIFRKHLEKVDHPEQSVFERILHPDGMPAREIYRLMGDGLSQIEALSQLYGNPPQLEDSLAWIRLASVLVPREEQT